MTRTAAEQLGSILRDRPAVHWAGTERDPLRWSDKGVRAADSTCYGISDQFARDLLARLMPGSTRSRRARASRRSSLRSAGHNTRPSRPMLTSMPDFRSMPDGWASTWRRCDSWRSLQTGTCPPAT